MFKSVLPQIADLCAKQQLIISTPRVLLLVTKLVCLKALLLILDYADTSISGSGFLVCPLVLFSLSFANNPQLVQESFRDIFRVYHRCYRLPF